MQVLSSNTEKIKVIIVDDEEEANKLLYLLLNRLSDLIEIVGIAQNTIQAEDLIISQKPEVVFFDIEMPNENAFQFLQRLDKINFEVVFVTAYDQFAIRALKLNAIDYLLKPLSVDELDITIQKIIQKHKSKIDGIINGEQIKQFAFDYQNKSNSKFIYLKGHSGIEPIEIASIYYVEANGPYSIFYYKKDNVKKSFTLSHPLMEYEDLLGAFRFFRIHKSFLINIQQIKSVDSIDQNVVSNCGAILPISRRRYHDFLTFLKSK